MLLRLGVNGFNSGYATLEGLNGEAADHIWAFAE